MFFSFILTCNTVIHWTGSFSKSIPSRSDTVVLIVIKVLAQFAVDSLIGNGPLSLLYSVVYSSRGVGLFENEKGVFSVFFSRHKFECDQLPVEDVSPISDAMR